MEWRDIPGFEGLYKISEDGDIINKNGHLMSPWVNDHGYKRIKLTTIDGNLQHFGIHQLVAMAFIPNPDNLPIVMHKDNNKIHNHYTNLKWGTISENTKQAYDDGLITHLKPPTKGNAPHYNIFCISDGVNNIYCKGIHEVEKIIQWCYTTKALYACSYYNRPISCGPYAGYTITALKGKPAIEFMANPHPKKELKPAIKFY